MRLALGIEYNGQHFFGWQAQKSLSTIQASLETALSKIAAEPIHIFCAGRTDAGVHATHQVIHFDTEAVRNIRAWTSGVNSHLVPTIGVKWAKEVPSDFHARFSALARRYRYIIHNNTIRPILNAGRVTWCYHFLNVEKMQAAAQFLLGEQDFSSFRSAECAAKSPWRNVHYIRVMRRHHWVVIEIQANAFLHHMVRNIAGVLMRIGIGRKSPEWAEEVLKAKDRCKAAETAAAAGLYLSGVNYPEIFALPPELQAGGELFFTD